MGDYPFGPSAAGGAGTLLSPSGDVTGVKDAAAIMAAYNAGSKLIDLNPTGPWYIAGGQVVINGSGIYINAPGVIINGVGSGDVIRMFDSSNYNTRTVNGGGILGMPIINGTAMTGNSCGVHAGDILQLALFVQCQFFTSGTTSKCVWLDNQWFFTEQCWGRILATSGTSLVKFDNSTGTTNPGATGSFDRFGADIFLENGGVGNGVVFSNGAIIINPDKMGIFGNFLASATAVYSVIVFDNTTSEIANGTLYIGVELDTAGAHIPTTINFDNGGFTGIHNCNGLIDFSEGSQQFAASNNSGNCIFAGDVFGDTTLQAMQALSRPFSSQPTFESAQTFFTGSNGWIRTGSATSYTGMIMQAGSFPNQTVTITNIGAGAITFAAVGTSNVLGGITTVIAGNTAATFVWDTTSSVWVRIV